MSDSESIALESDKAKRLSGQSISKASLRSSLIPQITLTEPANPSETEQHVSASHSSYTLSPASPRIQSAPSSPHNAPSLPLTRDLLRRKNKLDRILNYEQQNSPAISFSSSTAVDERITAGLGIFSPRESATQSAMGSGPRSRANSIRKEDHSQPSSPRYSDQFQFPWNQDPLLLRPSTASASSEKDYRFRSVTSSVSSKSGTSMRNAPSLNVNPAHHQNTDHPSYTNNAPRLASYPMIGHAAQPRERKSRSKLLNMLYNTAIRVVNSRVSESTEPFSLQSMPVDAGHLSEEMEAPRNFPNQEGSLSHVTSTEKPTTVEHIETDYTQLEKTNLPEHQHHESSFPPNVNTRFHYPEIGTASPLQGYSLCLFSPTHPLRLALWKVVRSRRAEAFLLVMILLHWFLLACIPIYENDQKSILNGHWNHYIILYIQIIYTIDSLCKIIVYGLWIPPDQEKRTKKGTLSSVWNRVGRIFRLGKGHKHRKKSDRRDYGVGTNSHTPNHKAYLNSFGNSMDFFSVLCYWVDFAFMVEEYRHFTLFKACSALRPLRLLSIFPGTAVILKSLETSWELLLLVSGFIFFFLLLFALIGLISFQGVFSRRCYVNEVGSEPILVEPALYCSGFYNGTSVVGPYNPAKDVYKYPGYNGYICSHGQICMEKPENNPNFGFVNFDTIFYAFLNCYTFVSLELWTEIMYQAQDADSTVAALYFCLGVYVISFVLTFLLFAVITSAFARVRAENSVSAFTAKKKQYPLLKHAASDGDSTPEEPTWMYEEPHHDSGMGVTKLKLRRFMVKIVKSQSFFYFGGFLVLLDLAFMCVRSVYVDEYMLELLDNIETAFTFVFAIEIVVRMAAALGSGESIINVVVFLVLATALCAPIFMLMFGGDFSFIEPDETELRFDTFWQSFVTLIMRDLDGKNYVFLRRLSDTRIHDHRIFCIMPWRVNQTMALFTRPSLLVSILHSEDANIMSGLYIAVILENFELEDDYIKQYQIKHFIRRHTPKNVPRSETYLNRIFGMFYTASEEKKVQVRKLPTSLTANMSKSRMTELLTDSRGSIQPSEKEEKSPRLDGRAETAFKNILFFGKHEEKVRDVKPSHPIPMDPSVDDNADDYELIIAEENRRAKKDSVPPVKSLLLFSERNRFRYWCKLLVGVNNDSKAERRNVFNWFIMACVVLSILMVILDEPSTRKIRTDTIKQSVFDRIDIVLSLVFVVEVIIRIIAYGLILPQGAYLRNPWNQLDFCVVLLNFIMIFVWPDQIPRGLTTVRSLRVLRLIRYFNGVREMFADLFHAVPLMLDALVLTFLVLIPFAVYGVNIFGGRLWLCNDGEVLGRSDCVGEYMNNVSGDDNQQLDILIPRTWQNPHANAYSYDSFPLALSHLFTITSTEAWVDSMFFAMSTPSEPGMQPTFHWNSPMIYHSIFYVVFMIVSHGTVQLFIGVIIEKFKQRSGISTLTLRQRQYLDLQRQLAEIKPTTKTYRPESRIRGLCYDLTANKRGLFSRLMMGVVVLNICVIASEFQNEPGWLENLQDYSYFAFTVIYVVEVIIKCLGLGWKKWTKSKWNWYDGFIAGSALILLILRFTLSNLWALRMERYCLVFAAFRLGEGVDALQTLYHTVAMSMPSIIRVSAVFMLVMCLFAMVFMEFFGLTKYGRNGTDHSNFRDYANALLLLVRMTTGEAWNEVMMDYTVLPPNCVWSDDYLNTDCGSPGWAYFLFNVFYIICTHIFMNLFTAVIISNFEYAYETRTRFTLIGKSDLRRFKHAWAEVDPSGTGYIQKKDVAKFLHHLRGRLRLSIYDDIHSISHLRKLGMKGIDERKTQTKEKGMALSPLQYNIRSVENCLAKLNPAELQRRRKEYNLYYMEIIGAETSKGISFADVLTIMSYRFINIEESLTLDPLIARLEKVEQLNQAYAVEKACGVFLTVVQRKRYLQQLWQKRNEEELKKLGANTCPSPGTDVAYLSVSHRPSNDTLSERSKRRPPPVPRIVVENVPAPTLDAMNDRAYSSPAASLSVPVSPMSFVSNDSLPGSPFGADSLHVVPGSSSIRGAPSPIQDYDESLLFGSGGLSPYPTSPGSRQNWLWMDGNASMSSEQAESLLDSLEKSPWSGNPNELSMS
ncbi:calcium channel protein [Apophysomyces ossiformis]|uniref:Calcium-channel protein CCH1 n=1 Tax=Apophysomyces ossiformis TaxID=679940 RepID=A0A8H7BMQ2_9FUNG|nr:calcium channel protein [Apophysomyces ossiformis]